jgi:uncharacterized protein YjeT (DUF2065 family)
MELILTLSLGLLCIIAGISLISLYQNLKRQKKTGGLSFHLRTAGIGLIIIGIGIIIRTT